MWFIFDHLVLHILLPIGSQSLHCQAVHPIPPLLKPWPMPASISTGANGEGCLVWPPKSFTRMTVFHAVAQVLPTITGLDSSLHLVAMASPILLAMSVHHPTLVVTKNWPCLDSSSLSWSFSRSSYLGTVRRVAVDLWIPTCHISLWGSGVGAQS